MMRPSVKCAAAIILLLHILLLLSGCSRPEYAANGAGSYRLVSESRRRFEYRA